MKEFILTQPYANLEEMLNSAEVDVYKEELMQSDDDEYAVVSRIGNRYDLFGNKIEGFAKNPFKKEVKIEEEKTEDIDMRYMKIQEAIENEIAEAVMEEKVKHMQEIAQLKDEHQTEIEQVKVQAKEQAKAELIEKLSK